MGLMSRCLLASLLFFLNSHRTAKLRAPSPLSRSYCLFLPVNECFKTAIHAPQAVHAPARAGAVAHLFSRWVRLFLRCLGKNQAKSA
jgi:hypothetical protein